MCSAPAPITLRAARPEDGAAVAGMCAALSRHEGGPAPTLTAAAFRRDGFGPDPSFSCVIAELAGRPAGYAMYLGDYDTDLMCHSTYLADLYVDTAARRCGIGRALMAAVARITGVRGGRTLHWNVLRSNPSARAFYATLGREMQDAVVCSVEGETYAALAATSVPAGLRLRQATAADVPALARLLEELLLNEGFDPSQFDLAGRLATDGFGERPAFTCHLAERAGAAVGYTLHWPTYDTEPAARCAYLSDIYVAPEARRLGVARALMGSVARYCAAQGAAWIEWEVRRDNAKARAFYASFAEEYPDVLPMIASGDAFAKLAAAGAAVA
jgi:ribosomal protein S18 acetylase RimI-like enzyme